MVMTSAYVTGIRQNSAKSTIKIQVGQAVLNNLQPSIGLCCPLMLQQNLSIVTTCLKENGSKINETWNPGSRNNSADQ
jgi:hypothetical protein